MFGRDSRKQIVSVWRTLHRRSALLEPAASLLPWKAYSEGLKAARDPSDFINEVRQVWQLPDESTGSPSPAALSDHPTLD